MGGILSETKIIYMEKLSLNLKLVQGDQITGFSYSFAKALTLKLKNLFKNGKVFEEGRNDESEFTRSFTPIAETVIVHLTDQLKMSSEVEHKTKGIVKLIALAEEFLAVFEE